MPHETESEFGESGGEALHEIMSEFVESRGERCTKSNRISPERSPLIGAGEGEAFFPGAA